MRVELTLLVSFHIYIAIKLHILREFLLFFLENNALHELYILCTSKLAVRVIALLLHLLFLNIGLPLVRTISELPQDKYGDKYGIEGLTNITVAGFGLHGMKEVCTLISNFYPFSVHSLVMST